jgi:hypothetical protein
MFTIAYRNTPALRRSNGPKKGERKHVERLPAVRRQCNGSGSNDSSDKTSQRTRGGLDTMSLLMTFYCVNTETLIDFGSDFKQESRPLYI